MKQSKVYIILLLFTLSSCINKEDTIEGSLYFKLIDFGSFYGLDKKAIIGYENYFETIRHDKSSSANDKKMLQAFEVLRKNNLLNSPWINLKQNEKIIKVYLTEKEYRRVKGFNHNNLEKNHQNVILRIAAKEIGSGIFYSDNILKIKVVDGKVEWDK